MRIKVKVKTKAGEQKVSKKSGNFYYVSVKAPPKEGKANKELVEVLAEYFGVPKQNIEIKTGHTAPVKYVEVTTDN